MNNIRIKGGKFGQKNLRTFPPEPLRMGSFRLHCWVKHGLGIRVPKVGGWAPILHLRCGVGEDTSSVKSVIHYESTDKSDPVFCWYMRVAITSPIEDSVVVTLINTKGIGKKKVGSVKIPTNFLKRGIPLGFCHFKLQSKKGKPVGKLYMRLCIQYPESLVLPPNPLSRAALSSFKGRGVPILVKLCLDTIEGVEAKSGLKIKLTNTTDVFHTSYPSINDGSSIKRRFWLDLHGRCIILSFKKKRLASWFKIGETVLEMNLFNSGRPQNQWHVIKNKSNIVVGRIKIDIQLQFYHSVIVPPDCTIAMVGKYQSEIFACADVLERVAELEASKNNNSRAIPLAITNENAQTVTNVTLINQKTSDQREASHMKHEEERERIELELAMEASRQQYNQE